MGIEDILSERARAYAHRRQLDLAERLGFGIHGMVCVTENKRKAGRSAIKVHKEAGPFERELAAYGRLTESAVIEICGFHVPRLIGANTELLVIEMTIVSRPFLLDFAGAYLDKPPEFPASVWQEWEQEKQEQFGARWPAVQEAIGRLQSFGIHMLDVSPNNIAFADE